MTGESTTINKDPLYKRSPWLPRGTMRKLIFLGLIIGFGFSGGIPGHPENFIGRIYSGMVHKQKPYYHLYHLYRYVFENRSTCGVVCSVYGKKAEIIHHINHIISIYGNIYNISTHIPSYMMY